MAPSAGEEEVFFWQHSRSISVTALSISSLFRAGTHIERFRDSRLPYMNDLSSKILPVKHPGLGEVTFEK